MPWNWFGGYHGIRQKTTPGTNRFHGEHPDQQALGTQVAALTYDPEPLRDDMLEILKAQNDALMNGYPFAKAMSRARNQSVPFSARAEKRALREANKAVANRTTWPEATLED